MSPIESIQKITKIVDLVGFSEDKAKFTGGLILPKVAIRLIEAGNYATCECCDDRIKFRARHRDTQVIVNFFHTYHSEQELDDPEHDIASPTWVRLSQMHNECYRESESPFGEELDLRGEHITKFARKLPRFPINATVELVQNANPN